MIRRTSWLGSLALLALSAAAAARAEAPDEPKALLEKAIKARGGAEALTKYPALTAKYKGRFHQAGRAIEYTEIMMTQPGCYRAELTLTVGQRELTFVDVLNGDKGWTLRQGKTQEMSKEQVGRLRRLLSTGKLQRLVDLRGKEYQLSHLGEIKVDDRPAVGIRVEREGERPVNLYFDKESWLLVKAEFRAQGPMGETQEVLVEVYPRDYKKVGDILVAHKTDTHRDGKLYEEKELVECAPADKLDDGNFAKP
jgi:hypothetical protein